MPIVTIEQERLRRKLARQLMKQKLRVIIGGKDTTASKQAEGETKERNGE
jgi:hypothetical protein